MTSSILFEERVKEVVLDIVKLFVVVAFWLIVHPPEAEFKVRL